MFRRSWLMVVCVAAVGAAGCSASSQHMRPILAGPPTKAVAGEATVVFVRPSGFGAALKQTILDGQGRFLGEALPSSRFAVRMPPGEHTLIVWAENTSAIKANLEAGKLYFVEVSLSMGAFSARADLLPIKAGSESANKLGEWLAEAQELEPNAASGQAYLAERREDVNERIKRANEHLTNYDANRLAAHTLGPDDGREQ